MKIDHSSTSQAGRANAVRFCSRCGEAAASGALEKQTLARTRVCQQCGMGMLLGCTREALPGAAAAFLVVTGELTVSAVSERAEVLFGPEEILVGQPVASLLTSPMGDGVLTRTVARAALRAREPEVMPVRGLGASAGHIGTMAARISTCGPPKAALITVERSRFGRRG